MWIGEWEAAELSLKGGLLLSEQEWGSAVHHRVYSKCDPMFLIPMLPVSEALGLGGTALCS